MKLFFVIALLCVSLSKINGQIVRGCGYPFQTFAITAGVARAQTVIATSSDHPTIINAQVYQQANGSWCYSFFVVTLPPPEPLPSPKPLKLQAQIGCAMISYERKIEKEYVGKYY